MNKNQLLKKLRLKIKGHYIQLKFIIKIIVILLIF